jgi:hypothetical protein
VRRQIITAVIGTFALFSSTACGAADSSGGTGSGTSGGSGSGSGNTAPKTSAPAAKTAVLPDLVGKGLQSAQNTAQAAGFFNLTSHDSFARGRNQIQDRNWKVCFQAPKAGRHSTKTRIDLGTVKLDESCPAKDAATPQSVGTQMPELTGKSVKVARLSLDSATSVDVKDASGEKRAILVDSNWKVCGQDPKPGTKLTGHPVSLTAVKFGESCP